MGSSPLVSTSKLPPFLRGQFSSNLYLPVAQLDSARDSDSRGRRFKSCRVGQTDPAKWRGFSVWSTRQLAKTAQSFARRRSEVRLRTSCATSQKLRVRKAAKPPSCRERGGVLSGILILDFCRQLNTAQEVLLPLHARAWH